MTASLFGTGNSNVNVNVNGTLVPQTFVATGGQTLFNLTGFSYVVGTNSLLVFVNGEKKSISRDFTETSSTSFTLLVPATVGDIVDVIGFPQTNLTAVTSGSVTLGSGYSLAQSLADGLINLKAPPYSAKGDGVTDDTAAINAAINAAALSKKNVYVPPGVYKHTSTITIPLDVYLIGAGGLDSSSIAANRSASCFLKSFSGGPGFLFAGDSSGTDGIQYDSAGGTTGDGVQVTGSRWRAPTIVITNAGQDGLRLSADAGSFNTNLWRIGFIGVYNAGRHGLHVNDPTGSNDACGGICHQADILNCLGNGIQHDNGAWNTFVGSVVQNCIGIGFNITGNSRGVVAVGGDLEGNAGGNGKLQLGCTSCVVLGSWFGGPTWEDLSGNAGGNFILQYDVNISRQTILNELNLVNANAGAILTITGYAEAARLAVGRLRMFLQGVAGGGVGISTLIDGGSLAEAIRWDEKQRTLHKAATQESALTLAYSASMTPDAALANHYLISANNGAAFTINAPLNTPGANLTQELTLTFRNISGGAMGAATFNAIFKLSAWTNPATGFNRSITFKWIGGNWIERNRTTVDVPN